MSNITNIQTLQTVTAAEIARCEKVLDCNTNEYFYIVESENYSENYTEYHVKAIKVDGHYHLTCNCDAGKRGVPCKHRRWAMAAARIEKANQAQTSSLIVDGQPADSETLARIEKANQNAKVDRSARAPKSRPFSLMR